MMNSTKMIVGIVTVIFVGAGVYSWAKSSVQQTMMADDGVRVAQDENVAMMDKKDNITTEQNEGGMIDENMKMKLLSLGNSGMTGEALLTPKGEKTEVLLTLKGGMANGTYPAHIHVGACPLPGAVKYALSPVVAGKSVTTIDVSVDALWKMLPLAINVHKSAADIKTYVACGDLGTATGVKITETMMKDTAKTGDTMTKGDTMMKVGSYVAYAPEKIAQATATGNAVLFFRASWCPTCRALDADIKANLQNIPGDLTILDVDYDNSTELKKKYGVTYQHTLVQVDKNGTMIKKWMGSPTLSAFVKEVQ